MNTLSLPRTDRVYAYVTVGAKDADGASITATGVQIALLSPHREPDEDTVWVTAVYDSGKAKWRVLLAGPAADPTDALVVPEAGADVWIRVVDNPEVLSVKVGRVSVG